MTTPMTRSAPTHETSRQRPAPRTGIALLCALPALVGAGCAPGAEPGRELAARTPETPQQVAAHVGCLDSYSLVAGVGLGFEAHGTCQVQGARLELYTFLFDNAGWRFVNEQGDPEKTYVTGYRWVVAAPTQRLAREVQQRTGGRVV